jgi:hypothetical protein
MRPRFASSAYGPPEQAGTAGLQVRKASPLCLQRKRCTPRHKRLQLAIGSTSVLLVRSIWRPFRAHRLVDDSQG